VSFFFPDFLQTPFTGVFLANRYTCVHPSCLSDNNRIYFATWSLLQSHIKKDHPLTCPHPSCNGKTFSNSGNFRAHLKLHEQRKTEAELQNADDSDGEARVTKRRRGGEYGRDWKCQMNGCDKDYKSVNYILPSSPSSNSLILRSVYSKRL
jgi:hypothetical protein